MNSFKNILSKFNYLVIYLSILFLFDLLLLLFPLTAVFGYEYSAFNSLFLIILSGFYTLSILRKHSTNTYSINSIKNVLLKAFSALLLLPLIFALINAIFGLNCSLLHGFLFYIFITYPSVVIGAAIGISSYVISKKFCFIIFPVIFFFIALIPVLEIYFLPQVYFYNPLIGFFPGTIYDEGLSVNFKLIIYRVINVLFFGSVFLLLLKDLFNRTELSSRTILISAFIIAAIFLFLSPFFGYSTSRGRLDRVLNAKVETKNFEIYYAKSTDEKLIKTIILHHEYYFTQLTEFFKLKPNEKITSFVFQNSKQKGDLFGAANADVAKPWLSQIYITSDNYNTTLKHEIAHIFTREFGAGLFRIADDFNPSLIEGIASAADPIFDENKVEYLAAVAYAYGYKVSIKRLFTNFQFFSGASTLSYIYSGAFVKYLVESYGIEKFKQLYTNLNFEEVYKRTLSEIEKEFYNYLQTIDVSGEEHTAHYYFGRKSIFQKVCPRYIADQMITASDYFNNNNFDLAGEKFRELFQLSESYAPLIGWINSLVKTQRIHEADSILTINVNKFINTAYYYNLELRLGELAAMQNNFARAESLFNKIILQKPERNLFNIARIRKDLLAKDALLNIYLDGNELNKYLVLRELNKQTYNYNSLPVLADLSQRLKVDYKLFLRQFVYTLVVNDYHSAYAVYKLSNYMIENLYFDGARRMAALTLRYRDDENFRYILEENFNKVNWLRNNSENILNIIQTSK